MSRRVSKSAAAGLMICAVAAIVVMLLGRWTQAADEPATPVVKSECDNWQKLHPNWLFADDFETGDWSRWGHKPSSGGLTVSDEKPLGGKYSMRFDFRDLGGAGYQEAHFQRKDVEEIRMRFYVYYNTYWHHPSMSGDHTLALFASGAKTSSRMAAGLNLGPWGPRTMRFSLGCNMGKLEDRVLHNGRWYRIELHVKLNTIGAC